MKKLFLLLPLLCISFFSNATHIIGGEITYIYLGANTYQITLKVYRDCSGSGYDNPLHITIFDTSGVVNQTINIPFPGAITLPNDANNPCLVIPPNICVEEAIYETVVVLPPITGGYDIVWQRCCRNGSILNIDQPINTGSTYLIHIPGPFAFENGTPKYNQFPPTVVCSS
jgi:hypothetical protein